MIFINAKVNYEKSKFQILHFLSFFLSESNFRDFLFASMDKKLSQKKSTLQGKNLLLLEQIFPLRIDV